MDKVKWSERSLKGLMEEVYSLGPQQSLSKQINVNCSYSVQFFSRGKIGKDIKNSHQAPNSLFSIFWIEQNNELVSLFIPHQFYTSWAASIFWCLLFGIKLLLGHKPGLWLVSFAVALCFSLPVCHLSLKRLIHRARRKKELMALRTMYKVNFKTCRSCRSSWIYILGPSSWVFGQLL